ncbi:C40 family peptidase [Streptomyces sp. H27-C3]|uniref:C40 family peptidase n=1 Tax=Streptomyces sp. H27-C3 TaxID=3046305 RepID=UPI0024B893F4|nr:C40 family peptidase [Streptomyces sp. H27-C3]MDJ0466318.1 NlpC/P60 family protein [Streptomyces sp. H27-C3]
MNGRRSAATAATLTCALAVLAVPGTAHADPKPPRSEQRLQEVRSEIDGLYRKAALATDSFNLAEERADKQSSEIVKLAREIVKGQNKIDQLKKRAGAEARAQYRGGGLPAEARLMLSGDPQLFLDGAGRFREGQQATKGLLGELSRTQADLKIYTQDATDQWKKLESHRKKKEAAKKEVKKQLAAAKKLESTLEKEERARLLAMEQEAEQKAQTAWLDSGALKTVGGKATASGKTAVAYATAQIGKPYVWGAEGPGSFDCSGLTSQAWLAAGRGIPRTSQEQWKRLPRVATKDMLPGDLIIYFGDASHVGMYIGDGAIVHAPRPGRDVTIAGAGSMPILGVVRPGN